MTAKQAVKLAATDPKLQAIQKCGVHLVTSLKGAEKLDAAGVCFAYLHLGSNGKIVSIPNGND